MNKVAHLSRRERRRVRKSLLRIRKRAYLTMIELFLVMGLIGITLSITVYPLKNAFDEWRYRKGLEALSQALIRAKFLSICYGSDCHVTFFSKPNGEREFCIESFEPLTPEIKKKQLLYGVKSISSKSGNAGKISFYSSGFHNPNDRIVITPSKGSLSPAEIELTTPFSYRLSKAKK